MHSLLKWIYQQTTLVVFDSPIQLHTTRIWTCFMRVNCWTECYLPDNISLKKCIEYGMSAVLYSCSLLSLCSGLNVCTGTWIRTIPIRTCGKGNLPAAVGIESCLNSVIVHTIWANNVYTWIYMKSVSKQRCHMYTFEVPYGFTYPWAPSPPLSGYPCHLPECL